MEFRRYKEEVWKKSNLWETWSKLNTYDTNFKEILKKQMFLGNITKNYGNCKFLSLGLDIILVLEGSYKPHVLWKNLF